MKAWVLLVILQLGANGSDAYFTNRVIQHGGREVNPLAKPFVKSTRSLVIASSLEAGAELLSERWLHKQHRRLSKAEVLAAIAGHAAGAVHNAIE